MMPEYEEYDYWGGLFDTQDAVGTPDISHYKTRQAYPSGGRSQVLLKQA